MMILLAFIGGVLVAIGWEINRLGAETRRSAAALESVAFQLKVRNENDYGKQ